MAFIINDNLSPDTPINGLKSSVNMLASQLKRLSGGQSWKDAPTVSITELSTPIKGDKGDKGEQGLVGATGLDGFAANIPYIPGRCYPLNMGGVRSSSTFSPFSASTSVVIFRYFCIRKSQKFDRLMIQVATGGNLNINLAIYDVDQNSNPQNLLCTTGNINCATTGYKDAVIDITLQPGLYCLAQLRTGTGNAVLMNYAEDSGLSCYLFGGRFDEPVRAIYLNTNTYYSGFPLTIITTDLAINASLSHLATWLRAA